MKPWYLITMLPLTFRDRLRLLAGVPLYVRFYSPDGDCHAGCDISAFVQRDWPTALENQVNA